MERAGTKNAPGQLDGFAQQVVCLSRIGVSHGGSPFSDHFG
jgi:hypothetical protein